MIDTTRPWVYPTTFAELAVECRRQIAGEVYVVPMATAILELCETITDLQTRIAVLEGGSAA